jgi:4-hydroxy-tetrahydrodipicolinate reductase
MTPEPAQLRSPTAIAIIGLGRMGQAVDSLATARGWPVVARLTTRDDITPATLGNADVAIEFTASGAAPDVIRACVRAGCAVVSGTTGWDDQAESIHREVRQNGGTLLHSSNFAVGAHLLTSAGITIASGLREHRGVDATIVETHHTGKRDAPSGTAKTISRLVGSAWGKPIPIASVRLGSVPGEHELIFDSAFEQVRITHVVRDRRVFAEGALIAAVWVAGRFGVFSMADVLGSASPQQGPVGQSHA